MYYSACAGNDNAFMLMALILLRCGAHGSLYVHIT